MADTTYSVILKLATEGSLAAKVGEVGAKAEASHERMRALGESSRAVGEAIAHMGERAGSAIEAVADKVFSTTMAFGKWAAAAGVGLATYGVVKLNEQLEETQISLGAIAQAQGFTKTFEQGFKLAGDQLKKMKVDVMTLPGDLGTLSNAMTTIATAAAQAGASMDDIRKLAGKTMLVGKILQVDPETASRQMARLLSGHAGGNNLLANKLGINPKEFNHLAPEDRLKKVNEELKKYDGATSRFGHSFVAVWTSLKDNFKYGLLGPATAELFNRVKVTMERINRYFDEHKAKVAEIANTIGTRLVGAWDKLEALFKRIEPWVAKIADHILHMQPGEIGQKLMHAGQMVLAAKVGGHMLSTASSALPMLMRMQMDRRPAQWLGAAGAGAGAGAGEAATAAATAARAAGAPVLRGGLVAGLVEALPTLGFALAGLTSVVLPAAGIFDNLTDSTRRYHEADKIWVERLGMKMAELGKIVEPVIGSFRQLMDDAGHQALKEANTIAAAAVSMGDGVRWFTSGVAMLFQTALDYTNLMRSDPLWEREKFRTSIDTPGAIRDHEIPSSGINFHNEAMAMGIAANKAAAEDARMKARQAAGTTIQKVEIVVSGNSDPSRVARLTVERLQHLARNPTASPYVPNYSR